MALEQELEFFEKHRREWVKEHEGKFALIKDQTLVDTFDTAENAYVAALERFGNVPVLIKQIVSEDPVQHLPALSYGLIRAYP
jgi:hypothetical protein